MKKTKRSLFISLVTLLLCSAMFVGSTFAWFTDTVSNTGNKIQAGTLDVVLEQYKKASTGAEAPSWVEIGKDNDPVFSYNLWEPGYSQYAVLRVRNNGNLALKYKLLLNVNGTLELNDNGHSIADAIDVYGFVAPNEDTAKEAYGKTTFEDFKAIDGVTMLGSLSSLLFDEDGAAYGILLPTGSAAAEDPTEVVGSAYAVLCLHMKEEAGNEYQGMALGTSFDITLNATQYTYEKDGFNSKDYDELANGDPDHPEFDNPTYPVTNLPIKTVVEAGGTTEVTQQQTIELPSGMKIEYPAGVPLTTIPTTTEVGNSTNKADQGFEFKSETPATQTVISIVNADSNKAVAQYELTLPVAQSNTTLLVKTTDKIVAGYINLKVFHNGTEIQKVKDPNATPSVESFYYNPENGEFVLWVYHSSPIEFVYDKEKITKVVVTNQDELEAAFDNQDIEEIKLGASFDLTRTIAVIHNVKVDFCGYTISAKGDDINDNQCAIQIANNSTSSNKLTFVDSIGGGKLKSTYGGVEIISSRGSFELNDVTMECDKGYVVEIYSLGLIIADDWSTVVGTEYISATSIIVNSGKIITPADGGSSNGALHGGTSEGATIKNTITINGGEFEVNDVITGIYLGSNSKLIINKGKFTTLNERPIIFKDNADAEVKGGTFVNWNPEEFVATGYKVEKNGETYTVVPR